MSWRKQIRASLVFAWFNGAVSIWRTPLWVVSYLMPPISFLFLLQFYAKGLSSFALIGGLVTIFAFNGIGILGDLVYYKTMLRVQDMIVASPVSSVSYMLGHALSSLLFSIPGILLLGFLIHLYGIKLSLLATALLFVDLMLIWASLVSTGFIVSTFIKEPRHAWPLTGILAMLVSVIPPVYYPVTMLPENFMPLSILIPTGAGSVIAQSLTGLIPELPALVTLAWAALVLEVAVLLILVRYRTRWREV